MEKFLHGKIKGKFQEFIYSFIHMTIFIFLTFLQLIRFFYGLIYELLIHYLIYKLINLNPKVNASFLFR